MSKHRAPYELRDVEWARLVEKNLTYYIDDLMDQAENGEDAFDGTGEPFCGCTTCHTRATIDFLITEVSEGIAAGAIKINYKRNIISKLWKGNHDQRSTAVRVP